MEKVPPPGRIHPRHRLAVSETENGHEPPMVPPHQLQLSPERGESDADVVVLHPDAAVPGTSAQRD
jgi:hypothetical protein